ncbi:MAG TPA: DUF2721 domain-containing protein [Candidatus Dormibacteraeota bacterium]|nr:DUF2721 domain-containing protein [Candidatus Dormibacteraeota bacterium]
MFGGSLPFSIGMSQSAPITAIIAQMIAPAVFILACGNLLNVTMTRVVRSVDRTRALLAEIKLLSDRKGERSLELLAELRIYQRRIVLLQRALSAYHLAIGLFVLASLAVALNAITRNAFASIPTLLTVIGTSTVLVGALEVFVETRLATDAMKGEIARELRE